MIHMRRCFIAICLLALFGCKPEGLTPEEKQKVSDLKSNLATVEKDIASTEKEIQQGNGGLIPALKNARIEVDKLTASVLRQHIAAIESGAKVDISIQATTVDNDAASSLEEEIKDAEAELSKTKAEATRYIGGLIKNALNARVALDELSLASLKQKLLVTQYGLYLPDIKISSAQAVSTLQQNALPSVTAQPKTQKPPAQEQQKQLQIEDPGPFDFRTVRWGMSVSDVQKGESPEKIKQQNEAFLMYSDTIDGKAVNVIYLFNDGKLWRAEYVLNENFMNKNKYIDAYVEFVSALKEKYGRPKSENTHWADNASQKDFDKRGLAYSRGEAETSAIWDNEDTKIVAKLSGSNSDISVTITYSSKTLEKQFGGKEKKVISKKKSSVYQ